MCVWGGGEVGRVEAGRYWEEAVMVCSRNPDTLGKLKDGGNWKVGVGVDGLSERMHDKDKSI